MCWIGLCEQDGAFKKNLNDGKFLEEKLSDFLSASKSSSSYILIRLKDNASVSHELDQRKSLNSWFITLIMSYILTQITENASVSRDMSQRKTSESVKKIILFSDQQSH